MKLNQKNPKGTTHINMIDKNGKQGKMTVKAFAGMTAQDFAASDTVQIEFLKQTRKNGFEILGVLNVGETAKSETPVAIHEGDSLTVATGQNTWNTLETERVPFDFKTCDLAKWDVIPKPLTLPGNVNSGLSMLVCSDNGKPLGGFDKAGNPKGRIAFNPHSYYVFNNTAMIGLVENFIAALDKLGVQCSPVTCGSVANRSRVFVTLKIAKHDTFKIGHRVFKQYIDFLNSHDKTCQITVTNSNICVCCVNTFRTALNDETGAFKMSVSHTKNAKPVLAEIPKLIQVAFKNQETFKAQLAHWHKVGVNVTTAEAIFAAFLGEETKDKELSTRSMNINSRLKELFVRGKGNNGETVLDIFQAVTEYYTHESAGDSDNATKQAESSEFGSGAAIKEKFFAALTRWTAEEKTFIGTARIGETILVASAKAKAKRDAAE